MNKAWVWKVGDTPPITRQCNSMKKVLCTVCFYSKGIVLQKTHKAGNSFMWGYYTDCAFFELNKYYQKKNQTYPTPGMCGIKLLHDNTQRTSQHWYKSIYPRKMFKLCHTFPTPRILHHVISFPLLFPCLKKSLSQRKFNSCQPSDAPFFSGWTISQKRTINMHLNNGCKD